MFQRFHKMREEREGGFTLIELLVVILIIAILAAIAIPVFLRQREKGWVSQVESALKNAATAQESFLTQSPTGVYATTRAQLDGEGLKTASAVNIENADIVAVTGTKWCVEATHDDLPATQVYAISSAQSDPARGTCNATADFVPAT